MVEWKEHLRRAVCHFGSQSKLAEAMRAHGVECSQSKISWLLVSGRELPAEDAIAIHRATRGAVTASDLRPDLWPTEQHLPIELMQVAS